MKVWRRIGQYIIPHLRNIQEVYECSSAAGGSFSITLSVIDLVQEIVDRATVSFISVFLQSIRRRDFPRHLFKLFSAFIRLPFQID